MLNHLYLGKSLVQPRLDVKSQRVRPQHEQASRTISWLQHHVSELLKPLPRR